MERYSEVLGLPVICIEDGKKVGVVKNIIFCPKKKRLLAFLLECRSYELNKKVVLAEDIINLGTDAVIINDMSSLKNLRKTKNADDFIDKGEVIGLRVYSKAGKDVGIVKDVVFDYKSCTIEGVEISDGLIQDLVKGRNVLPLLGKVEFGADIILVDNEAVEEMTETGRGLKNIIDDI
ncbi:PRC-barrel domain-containing protein [Acetivibrio cellulolyticus]|uniref:PRC-barrel domain-containing protein n=1 Tax=Acetivibrio cellulolyticus TaxID=35830 RepID=UPI0001E2D08F|nr:PRC-barrel domain-containing protein [Acetivibrio cellulolyticus]